MLNLICKTYDIQLNSIWLQKEVRKKTKWVEDNGLEFNEKKTSMDET